MNLEQGVFSSDTAHFLDENKCTAFQELALSALNSKEWVPSLWDILYKTEDRERPWNITHLFDPNCGQCPRR